MGAITSRQNAGVEEVDVVPTHAYRYPPRSGSYFGSHFIMGGERFDTPQPESYLFGENTDLNFLGSKPTPFPYPPPQPNEPTKTLKSLVNIRKESLRFVRASADYTKPRLDCDVEVGRPSFFNIEFTFDCDVRCSITIHYLCMEDHSTGNVTYISRDPRTTSETYHFKRGANQQFCQMAHVFDPSQFSEDDLLYDMEREVIPIAIHCVAEEGPEDMRQSHATYATVEKMSDGTFVLKALKQKLFVDGLCYLLQEIYGIENKNNETQCNDDDGEDNGSECVICMCDVRDTLILPCRHLCLCNNCADSLRYQANNCPICRAPFRALLQIRALQKTGNAVLASGNCENIPPGYEAVSLIEALNGPCIPRAPAATMPDLVETPENETAIQAAQILNRQSKSSKEQDAGSLEFGMSVLMPREEGKESSTLLKNKNKSEQESNDLDEDSEAEKLSPLLQKNDVALNIEDVVETIDGAEVGDADEEDVEQEKDLEEENKTNGKECDKERGDESDYYTPEEGAPNEAEGILSSIESTPQRLPGTPMSQASARSSQDSYTSGSSTRHLLALAGNNGSADRAVQI
ncbi:PREDICTED: E3 ubiquitin-protein ligase MGRN1 isoform X2 [Nicrophorus vespilloides]|uniref:RING-type E3 ubiquitin transferase n=1 Tax=Nicrophorus vespilloides TaxID=110193 RepID=A0ABM1MZ51_NICVS|nr:PREDICTED: E3 ubiquitin-protein ligase MGRN1 isoform X2 [Nicrophorus vespilloides]